MSEQEQRDRDKALLVGVFLIGIGLAAMRLHPWLTEFGGWVGFWCAGCYHGRFAWRRPSGGGGAA